MEQGLKTESPLRPQFVPKMEVGKTFISVHFLFHPSEPLFNHMNVPSTRKTKPQLSIQMGFNIRFPQAFLPSIFPPDKPVQKDFLPMCQGWCLTARVYKCPLSQGLSTWFHFSCGSNSSIQLLSFQKTSCVFSSVQFSSVVLRLIYTYIPSLCPRQSPPQKVHDKQLFTDPKSIWL